MITTTSSQEHFKYSVLAFSAAAFWGLYWLPLRKIEAAGISAAWTTFAIYLAPVVFLIPLCVVRRHSLRRDWRSLSLIGLFIGAALACYAIAFLHTTVLRTVLLFYSTPVWSTLLGIAFLNEKNNIRRWTAIAVGFMGLVLMLYTADTTTTTGFGFGDAVALLSGLCWGAGTVLIRKSPQIDSTDIVPVQYLFAMLISLAFIVFNTDKASQTIPSLDAWLTAAPYIFGFYIIIILPTIFICLRAAQVLSPGRIGILMMSEVLVAGITAPLLLGETLSGREWLAAALIILAGVIEVTSPVERTVEAIENS